MQTREPKFNSQRGTTMSQWLRALMPLLGGLFIFAQPHQQQTTTFNLYSYRIFQPDETATFRIDGINVREPVRFRIYEITDPVAYFSSRDPVRAPMMLDAQSTRQEDWQALVKSYPVVREWTEELNARPNQWISSELSLGVGKSGAYLIEARAHGKRAYTTALISPYAIVTKQTRTQLLSFLVERKTGALVANADVLVYRKKEKLAEGKTNDQGLFFASLPPMKEEEGEPSPFMDVVRPWSYYHQQAVVMARKGSHFIIADPHWYSYQRESDYLIYTYTERPVYRPAQEVFFKGIVRKKGEKGTLSPISNTQVKVFVRDARSSEIFADSMRTNANGTYHGRFTLGADAALGTYQLQTSINGAMESMNFEVQEYKKPEYEVTVSLDKKRYAKGETIRAAVKAGYYFGSPVAGANVEYMVYRSRYWRPWWTGTEYEWFYSSTPELYTFQQEMISAGSGKLDANGEFAFPVETDKGATVDYTYRIEANVVDASRRNISGSASTEVTRGLFSIGLQTEKYVYRSGENARISVSIVDFDGNGVAVPFTAKVSREWWERSPRIEHGRTFYDYQHHVDPVVALRGKTEVDGRGAVEFALLEMGSYIVSVSANDALDNTVTEAISIYSAQKDYVGWSDPNQGIQIVPDKQSYEVGETMRVLVVMPRAGMDVLVTSEADRLIDHRVERFASTTKIIPIRITDAHASNFFIGVAALVGDQLYQSTKQILVLPKERFLSVSILYSKETFKPGEETNLKLKVTDSKGKPVTNAELSLGMVDEGIYAIVPEKVPDIRKFFYANRWNRTQTWSSLYFSFFGYAQTDVEAMDGRGGRLTAKGAPMEEAHFAELQGVEPNGRKEKFAEAVLRKDFKDMMHWSPVVTTDDKGEAAVRVKFPDNLTTWRATVRAATADTRVGNATSEIIVRKNLLVRVETPRFLTQRDTALIATIVHNYLSEDKSCRLSLTARGASVAGREKTVHVPKDGYVRVDWTLAAYEIGTATLNAQALTDEESDAVQVQVPILPHGLELAYADVVDLQAAVDAKSIFLTIPDEANVNTAKVVVHLSPSLASSILTALDDLVGYPYGCVEQTMSRFLPTIIVANAFKDLGAPLKASVQQELPKMVDTGLKRLYTLQHQDGGWGWWENDNTDAFMTSYVVYGLTLAQTAGYAINGDALRRGIERVQSLLESSEKLEPTTRAYAIYVLAFAGTQGASISKSTIEKQLAALDLTKANNYTRSLVTLASYYSGDKTTAASVARTLESAATQTGTAAFWSGKAWHYNWQDDNVETTAFALKALLAARGDSKIVQQAVHWLIGQKRGSSWLSTKQSAIVIFALVDYLKLSKELQPDYTVTVAMNGSPVHSQQMTKEQLFDKEPSIEIKGDALKSGVNTLRIEKNGQGRLYCTARIRYYSKEENLEAGAAGFSVRREYFKLVRTPKGDQYVYEKQPFGGTVAPGDELFVRVTLSSDGNYEYFMLEDPLPPGVEVVKDERNYRIEDERDYQYDPWYYGWRYWWASREVHDEKVAFFARSINAGTYTFTYIVRAQIPGRYHVMPAVGSLMYYPEVRGNSDETMLTIRG